MKHIHTLSFGLGILSGVIALTIIGGVTQLLSGNRGPGTQRRPGPEFNLRQNGDRQVRVRPQAGSAAAEQSSSTGSGTTTSSSASSL